MAEYRVFKGKHFIKLLFQMLVFVSMVTYYISMIIKVLVE